MSDTTNTQATHDSTNAQGVPEPQAGQPDPVSAAPDDVSPPLAALITSIRAAVAKRASSEARAAGATACRSILTVLEAKPGQSLASNAQPASAQSPIAVLLKQPGVLNQLAAMSREQLLDLLKQVTGAVPARTQTSASAAPRFHLIEIPQVRRPDGM